MIGYGIKTGGLISLNKDVKRKMEEEGKNNRKI